jgi:site-specific recombinase XerD
MTRKIKGVVKDTDRHGNVRVYFRPTEGPKVRLHEPYDSAEFHEELACARLGLPYKKASDQADGPEISKIRRGSFGWLTENYLSRAPMADSTRAQKRRVLTAIGDETCLSKSGTPLRHMNYNGLTRKHIALLRDQKRDKVEAANHRVKALSALFVWAINEEFMTENPASSVKKFKGNAGGHHTWTDMELEQFEERHPKGTKARLAYTIFRYTGLRISDVARFGKQHLYWRNITVDDETGDTEKVQFFRIKTFKETGAKEPVWIDMPVLPPLAEALAEADSDHLTFLISDHGKPFSVKGLGNRMRKWYDEAGLKHCSSHGIRKADAVIAAESGATANQLLSMFGWVNIKQAQRYTRAANRRKLAETGVHSLLGTKKVGQSKS